MAWWLWILVGIALLVVEVATPGGLFALFFGAGALLVAPLEALGLPPTGQWLAFSVISLALLALLRGPLNARLSRRPPAPAELVGEAAVLLEDLPAGGQGRAELRGVPWAARAEGGGALARGQRCRVVRVDGLVLWVHPE